MSAHAPTGYDRLAIHTMTVKPWNLEQACAACAAAGIGGITVWRQHLEPYGTARGAQIIRDAGLAVPALCRGGFFPSPEPAARAQAIDENKRILDEAAAIGAEMVVLVCGAVPGMPLEQARAHIRDGIAACLDHAQACGVKLAIEPLHPMYAADRSAINTMAQARAICEELKHPLLGIAVDVYHVWWDDALAEEIRLAGEQGTLFGFHICDWRVETRDLLNDRGLMGEGCIDIRGIRSLMEQAGFAGFNEVEIFSDWHWQKSMDDYLAEIQQAYRTHA
ncbi:MAG: sugar phosphate isomerase/epimerase family protein [Planctomycetota bacterium]